MKKKIKTSEKIKIYENFLHLINMYSSVNDAEKVAKLIRNACRWSYAHRVGNGELSDKEQEKIIEKHLLKLCTFEND